MVSTSHLRLFIRSAFALGFVCFSAALATADPITWVGDGVDRNWSVGANWSGGLPISTNDVTFTTVGSVDNNSTITSIVDGDTTIAAIRFSNTSGDGADTQQNLQINGGSTLTVNGSFIVGQNATNNATRVSISGDTLAVGGLIRVGGSTSGSSGSNSSPAVLDLSGLSTLTKTGASDVIVGSQTTSGGSGPIITPHLILADTTTISATQVQVGGGTVNGTNRLSLGSTTNILNASTFQVGGGRNGGVVDFNTGTGTLQVRGLSGEDASRATLNILHSEGAGVSITSTMNLLGHAVDMKLDQMNVNTYGTGTTTGGTNTATFSFDEGIVDTNSLLVSRITGSGGTGVRAVNSTLNFNGGTVSINTGDVSMAQNNVTANAAHNAVATMNIAGSDVSVLGGGISIAGKGAGAGASTLASGTVNITAGSLTVAGDIIDGGFVGSGGSATTTLTLDGGTLDLGGFNIGGAIAIDNLNLRSGTLRNVAEINDGAGVSKSTAGTLVLEGVNTWTGATSVDAGTLLVDGSITSSVTVADGATLGGSGEIGGALSLLSGSSFSVVDLLTPLEVGGTVTIAAGFGVADLTGLTWGSVLDGTYTLIDGTLGAGVFEGLENNSLETAYDIGDGRTAYFQVGSLQLVVVPEPSALLLTGLGVLGFVAYRRNRGR